MFSDLVERRFKETRLRPGLKLSSRKVDEVLDACTFEEESVDEEVEQERRPSSPTVGYFVDAPSEELLGMFRSLTSEWRLDAALEVLRRLVQAHRQDVLSRCVQKPGMSCSLSLECSWMMGG